MKTLKQSMRDSFRHPSNNSTCKQREQKVPELIDNPLKVRDDVKTARVGENCSAYAAFIFVNNERADSIVNDELSPMSSSLTPHSEKS